MAQKIIIAHGIEIRDWDGPDLQKFLNDNCDKKGSTFTFPKGARAKATHEIEVVYTMAEFAKALDTREAFVVYDGHSRWGQGPAFGDAGISHVPDKKTYPINPWGVHFRMGFAATGTAGVEDLLGHSVTPVEYDLTTSGPKAFLSKGLAYRATKAKAFEKEVATKKIKALRVCFTPVAWRSFISCEPELAETSTTRGDTPLKDRHFYKQTHEGEFMVSVSVGSADLDKSRLACKILLVGSCSSVVHFYRALARRRKAVKSSCKFLLTLETHNAPHGLNFLKQVLIEKQNPLSRRGIKKILAALNTPGPWGDSGKVRIY